MKDTFKKLSKDALTHAKNEVSNMGVLPKTNSGESAGVSSGTSIGEKFIKKSMGLGDLLQFKDIGQTDSFLKNFILKGEKVYYYLESVEEELSLRTMG